MTIEQAKETVELAFNLWIEDRCCTKEESDATEGEKQAVLALLDELSWRREAA